MRSDEEVIKHINEIIDRQIQPSVEMHGGKVSLEKYEDGVATMFMSGACSGLQCIFRVYTATRYPTDVAILHSRSQKCLENRRPRLRCKPILYLTNVP